MRFLWSLLIIHAAFVIQASLFPVGPDLVLLCVLVFALRERRLFATALGLFAGLLFDLTAPLSLGANALAMATIGYVAASVHPFFYRARWYVIALTVPALVLKHAVGLIAGAGLPPWPILVILGLVTVALSPLVESLLGRIFSRRWQTS
uniref:Rod shape-determining protein MreD n=1 Tax=candidate division WOR-3 bacterium TaxID=2052148 RepID=A0A7C4CB26_UNCW3